MCQILLRNGENVTFEHEMVRGVEKPPEMVEVVRSPDDEKTSAVFFQSMRSRRSASVRGRKSIATTGNRCRSQSIDINRVPEAEEVCQSLI